MLRPEADALFIRDYGGNQLRLVFPDAAVTETEDVVELCEMVFMKIIPYKKKNKCPGEGTDVSLNWLSGNGISAGSPAAFLPSPTMRG